MNKWEKKIEKLQSELNESSEWVASHYLQLPETVKLLIVRGQILTENKIEKYKNLADDSKA